MVRCSWALAVALAAVLGGAIGARADGGADAPAAGSEAPAAGSEAPIVVLALRSGDVEPDRRRGWLERVRSAAAQSAQGPIVRDPMARVRRRESQAGPVMPGRVRALGRVQQLVVEARRKAGALREARALSLLSEAARIAQAHADVPGSAAWIAEVHVAIGVTAAQAGLDGLSESALGRAATLDDTRGIRAAEARPDVVRRAERIARAVAARPTGSFEVRSEAEGARVFLDGEPVGTAPVLVRAPVGTHVLRVQAPGRLAWGRVMQVYEGRRPPMTVRLAPTPALSAARRLGRAAQRGEVAELREALGELQGEGLPLRAWLVQVGQGERDRALLIRCHAQGCGTPSRLSGERPAAEQFAAAGSPPVATRGRFEAELASARRWLLEPPASPPADEPPPPWWKRWYTWAAVGVAAASAATAAGMLARPEPQQRLDLVVDFGPVGPGAEE